MLAPSSAAALLPSTLLPLLLLFPTSSLGTNSASADRSACIQGSAVELSVAAACGDKGSLEYCFKHVPSHVEAGDLERCFRNAGCTTAEAGIEARFVLHNCDNGQSVAELRRRGPEPIPAPTPEPVPAPQDAATTTAATTAAAGFTPSIQCSTETTIDTTSCPVQSTGAESGSQLSCFPTSVATQVCAAENICMKDSNGLDICMLRQDSLNTGGIVVTIILAVVFALGFGTLIVFCCRDKRAQHKLRARQEAAAIAKESNMNNHQHPAKPASDPKPTPSHASLGAFSQSATTIAVTAGDGDSYVNREQSPPGGSHAPMGQNPFADGPRY
ncbi:hypothetical protein F4677DRAFT_434750 [Hypoxylon crocopeplum]|nr:hypothetical protein F4677DRAFT_434750 [Hypoxylon crocopeplum]